MSEPEHTEADRDTASDRVPIDPEQDQLARVGMNRRLSHAILPPRKWRKIGLRQIVCPECRAIVGSIQDGFWHLQTTHGQGKGVDLEAWGMDLRAELDEYIDAAEGRRGLTEHDRTGMELSRSTFALLGILVTLVVLGIIYAGLH